MRRLLPWLDPGGSVSGPRGRTGTRYQVPGTRYRVPAIWHRDLVPGTGAGPMPRTEHRAPKTEPSYRKTRTRGLHPASCILRTPCAGFLKTSAWYRVPGPGYLAPGTWYPAPEPVRRRGPNTEHRRPGPATGKRAPGVCILHPASCIPRVRVFEDKRLVPGSRSRVPGTRYRINAEGRTPSTEDRARHRKTRTPGLHPASCILHPPSPDKGRVRGKGSTTPLPYCLIALLP